MVGISDLGKFLSFEFCEVGAKTNLRFQHIIEDKVEYILYPGREQGYIYK